MRFYKWRGLRVTTGKDFENEYNLPKGRASAWKGSNKKVWEEGVTHFKLNQPEIEEFTSTFPNSPISPKAPTLILYTIKGIKILNTYLDPVENKKEEISTTAVAGDISNVSIKEYRGQRVVTFKDIDEVHGRPEGTANRNFKYHQEKFIAGEDFFFVQGDEIRNLGLESNYGAYLLTESGYLMLVKSFTDDLSWKVQRQLVKTYFRAKKQEQLTLPQTYEEALEHLLISVKKEKEAQKQIKILSPKAERYEDLMNAENCQDMNEVAKAFKTGRNRLFEYLREQKVILPNKPLPYQKYIDKQYFIVIDVEKNGLVHSKTLVTPMGIDFISKLLNEKPPKQGFFDKVKSLFTKTDHLIKEKI